MAGVDAALVEGAARIFRDRADPRDVNAAADDSAWRAPLWRALEEAGVARAWLPESAGGAGASMADGFAILRRAGAHAVAVPLAETLVAGWLLARAGLPAPGGPLTAARAEGGPQDLFGAAATARAVPFAAEAEHIALAADGRVALFARAACRVGAGVNPAGEPRAGVAFAGAPLAVSERRVDPRDLELVGAAARAAQMAGALEAVLEITVDYAKTRVAFARPIGKFQAVQHELAKLAGEAAAAVAASGAAAEAMSAAGGARFDDRTFMEVAAAKIRVGEAAGAGAAIAHQMHGAIGFTLEHVLQRFTRRLWSWRDDFGAESRWAAELGRMVAAAGADGFWPLLTTPVPVVGAAR